MSHWVYIIYSPSLDMHYIGSTKAVSVRLVQHNSRYYSMAYTSKTFDWELYFQMECDSKRQALQIEGHIKKMKSRKYLENLKRYPKIGIRLKENYVNAGSSR